MIAPATQHTQPPDPAEPVDLDKLTESAEPPGSGSESDVDSAKPADRAKPAESVEPGTPGESGDSGELAEPGGSAERVEPAESVERGEPVDPSELAKRAKPGEPAESVDHAELAESGQLAEQVESGGLAESVERGELVDPSELAKRAKPGEPAESVDHAELAESGQLAEQVESGELAESVERGEPVDPSELTQRVKSGERVESVEPTELVEPGQLAEQVESGESVEPAGLAGTGELAERVEPGESAASFAVPAVDDESDVDSAEVAIAGSDLPDLTEDAALEAALESLLLVVDSPAEEELLATALDVPITRIVEALQRMAERYTEQQRGIDLRKVGGGWRFYTRDKYAPFVEKLLLDGQRARLTRAALETLAVIAYRQPVTRQRVAAVRGVNVDGVIRTLLARGLIEETGTDSETGGFLFRTTELFLERIGLSSLEDLPPIAPLLPEVDAIDDV